MILKHGIKHRKLKLYKVYINDDPGMTLTYFMQKSLGAYAFECKKCYTVIQRVKLAANEQINRKVMFLKRF